MNDLEQSMLYEAAYGEMGGIIESVRKKQIKNVEESLKNGEEPDAYYDMVLDALKNVRKEFRAKSDAAFAEHKKKAEIVENGMINLVVAIGEQMAVDYEIALRSGKVREMIKIEECAEPVPSFKDVLARIRRNHKQFVKKANEEIVDIIEDTKEIKARRDHYGLSTPRNPHRCPLCGGGMYAKCELKPRRYLVCCTGCFLQEVVTLPNE